MTSLYSLFKYIIGATDKLASILGCCWRHWTLQSKMNSLNEIQKILGRTVCVFNEHCLYWVWGRAQSFFIIEAMNLKRSMVLHSLLLHNLYFLCKIPYLVKIVVTKYTELIKHLFLTVVVFQILKLPACWSSLYIIFCFCAGIETFCLNILVQQIMF